MSVIMNSQPINTTLRNGAGFEPSYLYQNVDGISQSVLTLSTAGFGQVFNETSWDRQRGNTQGTLLASAARTANLYSPIMTNYNARGIIITVAVSVAPTGTSPIMSVQIVDVNGIAYSPGSSNISAAGTFKFVLYPSALTVQQNSIGNAQLPLGRQFMVYFSLGGTTPSFTFSATYELIL